MSKEDRHHKARASKPPEGSLYEFLVTALTMLDAEPVPSMFSSPLAIPIGASKSVRAHIEDWNAVIDAMNGPVVAIVKDMLRDAGMPELALQDPMTAETTAVVDMLRKELVADSRHLMPPAEPIVRPPPHVRVAGLAWCLKPRLASGHLALYLCDGPRRIEKSATGNLTRDHLHRAKARYHLWLYELRLRDLILGALAADILTMRALHRLHAEARRHSSFAGLRGGALATAIHERHDMPAQVSRVARQHPEFDPRSVWRRAGAARTAA